MPDNAQFQIIRRPKTQNRNRRVAEGVVGIDVTAGSVTLRSSGADYDYAVVIPSGVLSQAANLWAEFNRGHVE